MKFNLPSNYSSIFKTIVLVGLFLFYIYIIASYFFKFQEGIDGDPTTAPTVAPLPVDATIILPTATGISTTDILAGSTSTDVAFNTAYQNLVDSYTTNAILQQVANSVTAYKMAVATDAAANAPAPTVITTPAITLSPSAIAALNQSTR